MSVGDWVSVRLNARHHDLTVAQRSKQSKAMSRKDWDHVSERILVPGVVVKVNARSVWVDIGSGKVIRRPLDDIFEG